jgi:hypothetical protein
VADITQQVLVELILDDSQLQPALDKLESSGQIDASIAAGFKQTTAEINKQAQAAKSGTAAIGPLKKNLADLALAAKKAGGDFEQGFAQGVTDALKEAGVSMEEFVNALASGQSEAVNTTESLRSRLKNLTQQIAQVKLTGEQWEGQLQSLVSEAGNIKDAMADAGAEIKNAASDTRTFDNLLGSAQAVAGGFAVAQGAAALFWDESEELQKTLLKVNSLMAILQGLQSIGNALQKEGAIVQLLSNKQKIIGNAQLAIENGLNSTSVVVRLAAAAAQRVLNAVMAANPIFLFISALVLVVSALAAFIVSSRKAEIQTGELNDAVEAATEGFENYAEQVKLNTEKITSELEKNGALQSKILEAQQKAESDINQKRSEEIARLRQFLTTSRDADEDAIKAANARLAQLNKERNEADTKDIIAKNALLRQLREEDLKSQIASAQSSLLNAKEGSKRQLQLQKQLVTLQSAEALNTAGLTEAEKTEIIIKAQKDRQELDIAFNKRAIDLQLKTIESQLINVEEGSKEEFLLKQKQLKLQTQSEIQSSKLSEAEKKAIKEKGFQDQVKLQREFNERVRREAIEGQISLNNVALNQLKTSDEDRLLLEISNLELTAKLEIDAAKGNANKIKEINAKLNADILAARKKFLEDELNFELSLQQARQGAQIRALEKVASNEKLSFSARKTAIAELTQIESSEIDKRLALLEKEKREKLISEKDYQLKYAQLQDQKKQITEKSEKDITELTKQENAVRKEILQTAITGIQELFSGLNSLLTELDTQRIDGQKKQVADLLQAGAITEKEAAARNKRIEIEEKRIKREAAQRDKALAIFTAVINTAKAVTSALTAPPPFGQILAAIVGALGAAQIALIASNPIPKFRTGKKNQYEGPGKIGEAGAELFEHNGKMYLAKKETLVWMGKDDKVYTPTETKQMLPDVDRNVMRWKPEEKQAALIDYDQLGKAVGKNIKIPGVTVDEDGFKVWEQEGRNRKNYMDKYYSSK